MIVYECTHACMHLIIITFCVSFRVWEKFMEGIKAMLPAPGSGPPPTPEAMKAIQAKVK